MARAASARRYARAAFEIARERDGLEQWRQDLDDMAAALEEPVLLAYLESPKVPFADKEAILRRRLEGADPLVLNLAFLLTMKGRLGIAGDIAATYRRLVDEHRGIAHVEVTTAVSLDDEERAKVIGRLGGITGQEVVLSERVDPTIIGGLVARVGDRLIDGSTRSRLAALKESLLR
ncbi:MAG: ATP synthase F1 subunit delta [Chloroflexota bacterium]|nr:ATP synthase F1 subunit delta [Chloroflexota bacterium]